jgi:hypothetical protein
VSELPGAMYSGFVHAPTLDFRGTRNYIHSTDLYEELIAGAASAGLPPIDGNVELRFRNPIITQPEFHFGDDVATSHGAAGSFTLGITDRTLSGQIVASDRPVSGRKSYEESRIWTHAQMDDQRVEIAVDSGMKPIEVVTALAVLQHNTLFPPPPERRWFLTRLFLARRLVSDDARAISIAVERVIGRTMTRCTVTTPMGQLGNLDFILGKLIRPSQ